MNMVYAFFLISWLFFLLQLADRLRPLLAAPSPQGSVLRQIIMIATIIGLLASFNTHDLRLANLFTVPKSLAKRIPQAYNAELNARYKYMAAATADTLGIAPLQHLQGNLLYTADIIPLVRSATNRRYAKYWGANIVYLDTTQGR
jgi:hypothetical protein